MSANSLSITPAGPMPGRGQTPEGLRVFGHDDSIEDDNKPANIDVMVGRDEQDAIASRYRDAAPAIHEAIDDPHGLAREVLTGFAFGDGFGIVYYRGDFYVYDGTCYRPEPQFKELTLVRAVKNAVDRRYASVLKARQARKVEVDSDSGVFSKTVPKVSRRLTADVAQALASMVAIDANQQAPFWISPVVGDPDPIDILPAANGLLDLSVFRPTLMPHTPRFFSTSVLPYPYDPHAAPPDRWSKFLLDQWPDDPDSISTLDEVIGYLLTPDTRQHKMFFLIGPPRSGRSTIKEVITALIGAQNVAACSPQSLSGEFGLEPLIGKSLAIMADVRTGANTGDVLDRLLRISGGDPVEVNCKHKTILANVGMRTRFLVVSNEMPEFRDPSKAITTRYLVLRTSKSIQPDQRDPDLLNKLREELPGILNLAIEGRRRLRERGRFLQPASALHLIEQAEDLASPVAEFARECLVLNPAFLIPKQKAFECWKAWAEKNGHKVGSSSTFGKNLIAALSGSGLGEYRPRDGQRQVAHYTGIGFPDGGGRET